MSSRNLTAVVSLAAFPLALGALLWRGLVLRERYWIELDPFEIDLQLTERND